MSPTPTSVETKSEIVSSEGELLVLVDSNDREIGQLDKSSCHDGDGVLHRAFSVFVFNGAGELLLQRRAAGKRLWPGYWSNSCCSHPRAGEALTEAVTRRVEQELGLSLPLRYLYRFEYQARFGDLGSEHELCSVFVGRTDAQPVVNTTEIDAWRWVSPEALNPELEADGDRFTPWFKMEWRRLTAEFDAELKQLWSGPTAQHME
ncbi:MAG: isopentenyl-diphosphate Delta-isomerase [Pseudomonadales bacterium]